MMRWIRRGCRDDPVLRSVRVTFPAAAHGGKNCAKHLRRDVAKCCCDLEIGAMSLLPSLIMESGFLRSLLLFALAGLCEIGGGYLVWLWLREGRTVWFGAVGGLILFLYGVLPTLQPAEASFGRVYAAYGGVFVVLSLAWGWWIDGVPPDRWDLLGGVVALVGVGIIMYAPRG
jgi:small multidrug resistance family-3 protein